MALRRVHSLIYDSRAPGVSGRLQRADSDFRDAIVVRASPVSYLSIPWVWKISSNSDLASSSLLAVSKLGVGRRGRGWLVGVWAPI